MEDFFSLKEKPLAASPMNSFEEISAREIFTIFPNFEHSKFGQITKFICDIVKHE